MSSAKSTKDRTESRWRTFSADLKLKLAEEQERMRELLQVQQLITREPDKELVINTLKKVDMESAEELQAAISQMHATLQHTRQRIIQEQQPDFVERLSTSSDIPRNKKFPLRKFVNLRHNNMKSVPYEPGGRRSRNLTVRTNRRTSGSIRNSFTASTCHSPAGSQSQLAPAGGSPSPVRRDLTIPEDEEVSLAGEEEDVENKSLYMDELPSTRSPGPPPTQDDRNSVVEDSSNKSEHSSVHPAASRKTSARRINEGEQSASGRRSTMASAGKHSPSDMQAANQTQGTHQMTKAQILESIVRREEDPRLAKLIFIQEKRSSAKLRAEVNIRPKSSAELVEHVASLPSNRVSHMPGEMRQRFAEIGQEKALVLHDVLEAIERERMRKMQNKFVQMSAERSLHRALKQMRNMSNKSDDEERIKRRNSCIYQQWYMDLETCLPEEVRQDWYFEKILAKLSKYGSVEASKQSTFKFLKVLTGLRDWEICSPDVSAAIEFCRAKIVEMSVDEYEEFFRQQFPAVARPHTAPAAVKSKSPSRTSSAFSTQKSTDKSRSNAVPKSAPVGGRKY